MTPSVVFLHGRPSHPFHQALARSVGADFLPFDFLLRHQDVPASRARRYLSWLGTSALFPAAERYDLFLTEGLQFQPLLMKAMGRLRPGQKAVALLANETLYFLREGRYNPLTRRALLAGLRAYDAFICHGQMLADLTREALGEERPIYVIRSGLSAQRRRALPPEVERPGLMGGRLLYIARGTTPWRAWYKGVDLAIAAVAQESGAPRAGAPLSLSILGGWPGVSCFGLREPPPWLDLMGEQEDLLPALRGAALYLALGRGDAGPLSVLEAMHAGVPALVSEWTGLRDAAAEVDPELVVPLDAGAVAARIRRYLDLPLARRIELGVRAHQVAARYTEEQSIADFRAAMAQIAQNTQTGSGPGRGAWTATPEPVAATPPAAA
jgi:glycosyltransferase involved in cell wall biosynthesis